MPSHTTVGFQVSRDGGGDPSFNQWLSLQRAEAVVDYLVSKGVSEERLSAAGYGGQQPVSSETTPEAMRMNRRIELRPRQ